MKKTVLLGLCVLYSAVAHADYLDDKIATLTQQKLDIIAELEKCQKASGNLKIAGITTLGVSAIGIGANIAEAVALNKTEDKIDAANTKLETLDGQIADAQAKKAAEEAAKQSKTSADQDEIESCSEEKQCDGSADLGALNAKSADCLGGHYVATACADGVTYTEKKCKKADENVFVYYQCEKPAAQNEAPKKHHEDCSADETAKLAGAASSWWSGSMKKCVVKSCQDNWFLVMKGKNSQDFCRNTCPEYQIVDGPNGGMACNELKTDAPVVSDICVARKVFAKKELAGKSCVAKCVEWGNKQQCSFDVLKTLEIPRNGNCICNPNDADYKYAVMVIDKPKKEENKETPIPLRPNENFLLFDQANISAQFNATQEKEITIYITYHTHWCEATVNGVQYKGNVHGRVLSGRGNCKDELEKNLKEAGIRKFVLKDAN